MNNLGKLETLSVQLLVEMLDPDRDGYVSLDRLTALADTLEKDIDNKSYTSVKLIKASAIGAFVVLMGTFVFIELEYDEYEAKIESNLLVKGDIELALPIGNITTDILELTSQYDTELDTAVRAMYEDWLNETLWDQLESNGFVSTYALANPWKFESAAWFVFTIATTVGYGHIVPNTTAGYIFVIIYSVPAIIWMGYFIKQLINFYKSCPCKGVISLELKLTAIIVLFIVYLTVSGLLFSWLQPWTFIHGVYFTWVTISTIGFGDYTFDDGDWWENMVDLFVILNGLFLASYLISIIGDVIERISRPQRLKEVFSRSKLRKVELMSLSKKIHFKKKKSSRSGRSTDGSGRSMDGETEDMYSASPSVDDVEDILTLAETRSEGVYYTLAKKVAL